MAEPIVLDLAGATLTQAMLDKVYGLAQLEHEPITIVLKNIASVQFPRLIVDHGQIGLSQVVVDALEFEKRLQSVELALSLRTDELRK